MPFTSLFAASCYVNAHGGVIGYTINGAYASPARQRQWEAYDPVLDPNDSFLACNLPGINLGSGQRSASVPAGSKVVAHWNRWPHDIGASAMAHMARCSAGYAVFEIAHEGLNSGTLIDGSWGLKEPSKYLLRHELLAIHTPFYPNCAQLIITGNGKGLPSPTVKIPGAYSRPGVMINIYLYFEQTNYTIPVPPM
ncbi:glycoside hydrolase [Pterulicium gracile]|uniref:AA9 family lytic polysaccharide monooxygenase n=1 Tax=Pterulicium gracile TaxID=1884261 RepID=A0A5C3QUC6_9AGAR|nr:glycoside hydrolase [Pterula gracilis]